MARAYEQASRMLEKMLNSKNQGIKSLIFNNSALSNKRQTYKLVCETLKYKSILEELLLAADLGKSKARLSMLLILAYELLFGKKKIQGGGKVKKMIVSKQSQLQQSLLHLKAKRGVSQDIDLLPESVRAVDRMPRYCRVNTILTNMDSVKMRLKAEGFKDNTNKFNTLLNQSTQENCPSTVFPLKGKSYYLDPHIPGVLVLPPKSDFHQHDLVKKGHLVLQDKASCFTAAALDPEPTWECIDACAAPGNKTSHLIALLHQKQQQLSKPEEKRDVPVIETTSGESTTSSSSSTTIASATTASVRVVAFERDRKRSRLLARRLQNAGIILTTPRAKEQCWQGNEWHGTTQDDHVKVLVRHGSFLDSNPEDYPDVKAILVDPTCSGSGMIGRVDHLLRHNTTSLPQLLSETPQLSVANERVLKIAAFQKEILAHALSFPSVVRVAYSTCSVHNEENEEVVKAILQKFPEFQLRNALPKWPRRGREFEEEGSQNMEENIACHSREKHDNQCSSSHSLSRCVRTDPLKDLTTGFFVAIFERNNRVKKTRTRKLDNSVARGTTKKLKTENVKFVPSKVQDTVEKITIKSLQRSVKKKKRKSKCKRIKLLSTF